MNGDQLVSALTSPPLSKYRVDVKKYHVGGSLHVHLDVWQGTTSLLSTRAIADSHAQADEFVARCLEAHDLPQLSTEDNA